MNTSATLRAKWASVQGVSYPDPPKRKQETETLARKKYITLAVAAKLLQCRKDRVHSYLDSAESILRDGAVAYPEDSILACRRYADIAEYTRELPENALTLEEAAAQANVSLTQMHRRIKASGIPAIKYLAPSGKRKYYYRKADIELLKN